MCSHTTDRKGKIEAGVGHAKKTPLRGLRVESLDEALIYLDRWEALSPNNGGVKDNSLHGGRNIPRRRA
jgi:hypothetical protein